ncbi:hypothetical protein EVAR_25159_1 [Eumeta japonica]|uniref:Uncharacterized protein n=1 Tax=Eumeta variegata TaxID=151549 RepID=A0A4C1VRM9_EUMVA|nr:hypothetical protein EVAR_25159_1 [Eumeta japonica]
MLSLAADSATEAAALERTWHVGKDQSLPDDMIESGVVWKSTTGGRSDDGVAESQPSASLWGCKMVDFWYKLIEKEKKERNSIPRLYDRSSGLKREKYEKNILGRPPHPDRGQRPRDEISYL